MTTLGSIFLAIVSRFARLSLTLAVVAAFPFAAHSSEATVEIARFFNAAGRAEYGLKRGLEILRQSDPQAEVDLRAGLTDYSGQEMEKRIARLFDAALTQADVSEFQRFAYTPAGRAYGAAFQQSVDGEGLKKRLSALGGETLKAVAQFENSAVFKKLFQVMSSPQARAIGNQYGEELMCNHYAKNDAAAFKRVNALGKCLRA
ncbi:hypothetical protein [Variovorax fucosicus]|uniref:hypothetical protein n=1 Tax=Variovorax fucosicus TaxID=3053517 RepID=UPI0025787353|nr:hypothetical protein [Variovorax sp. J22G47]MDM0058994.1 hypothetical protein [Variovorax sp. J22G47]